MTDLVERLRKHFPPDVGDTKYVRGPTYYIVNEAADRIEEMEKALERIERIIEHDPRKLGLIFYYQLVGSVLETARCIGGERK